MIIVTGAAGFIGSAMVRFLNNLGRNDLILVDDFSRADKKANVAGKGYLGWLQREGLAAWLQSNYHGVEWVIHLGARTDTTETNTALFDRLNVHYTQELWQVCVQRSIPLIYASSAATYGMGELGYDDRHDIVSQLQPLNPYGRSKNDVDAWILQQTQTPPHWYGLKFFNVYGPNEYHKGRMASVVFHGFKQLKETGEIRLFRSHRSQYADGQQLRDFVYVKDIVSVIHFLMRKTPTSGLYNVGTGHAEPFLALGEAVFAAMQLPPKIVFVDMPADIRTTYQYFTEANMEKLRSVGYQQPFYSLAEGTADYVQNYLLTGAYW